VEAVRHHASLCELAHWSGAAAAALQCPEVFVSPAVALAAALTVDDRHRAVESHARLKLD